MGSKLPAYTMRSGSTTNAQAMRMLQYCRVLLCPIAKDPCLYTQHRATGANVTLWNQHAKCTMQASVLHWAMWSTLLQTRCARCIMPSRVHHRLRAQGTIFPVVLWHPLFWQFERCSSSTSGSHGAGRSSFLPQLQAVQPACQCRVVGKLQQGPPA